MVQSTLAFASLFLLIDAIVIRRTGYGDALVPSPKFRHHGLIGAFFFVAVVAVIGMPPLSGFIGKLLILDATSELSGWPWIWGFLLVTSLLALIGFASSGSLVFWKSGAIEGKLEPLQPTPIALPMVAVGTLLGVLVLMTGFSGPVSTFFDATADQLFHPQQYIDAVLNENTEVAIDG